MCKAIAVLVAIIAVSSSAYCADLGSQTDAIITIAKSGDLDRAAALCVDIINSHPVAPFEPRVRVTLGYTLTKKKAPTADIINQFYQAALQQVSLYRQSASELLHPEPKPSCIAQFPLAISLQVFRNY